MKNVRLGAQSPRSKKSLKPEFFVRIFPKPCTITKIQLSIGRKKKKLYLNELGILNDRVA